MPKKRGHKLAFRQTTAMLLALLPLQLLLLLYHPYCCCYIFHQKEPVVCTSPEMIVLYFQRQNRGNVRRGFLSDHAPKKYGHHCYCHLITVCKGLLLDLSGYEQPTRKEKTNAKALGVSTFLIANLVLFHISW